MVHVLRAMHDAIMVGIGTVLADDPLMTVRLPGIQAKPLRVVLDAGLRVSAKSRLLRTIEETPVLVLTSEEALAAHGTVFHGIAGLEILPVALEKSGSLDLRAVLRILHERGITRVFSEGGPSVASNLVTQGLADEVYLLTAPKPLGHEGVPTMSRSARELLNDPAAYRLLEERAISPDALRVLQKVS